MAEGQAQILLRYVQDLVGGSRLPELPDEQLLERFVRQREEAAFAGLVERHGPMVLRVCRRVLRDHHAAEDAFQATFLVLARKAASIGKRERLANWLYGVASRIAANARAKAARRHRHEAQAESRPPVDTAVEVTGRELCAVLDDELRRLPECYREPFHLCFVEGLTRDQAARQLGCSLRTLHRRLERGRELLRARLARRGVTLSAALLAAGLTGPTAVAAVPPLLASATVRAAVTPAGGEPAAAALADGVLQAMAVPRLKVAAVLVLALGALAVGAGLGTHWIGVVKPQEARREAPMSPPDPIDDPPQRAMEKPPRADRPDDPLPPGAVARLGTSRLRHGNAVSFVTFTPDGRAVISGSDGTVRLWDASTGKEIRTLTGHPPGVTAAALAPDGKTLAVACQDKTLRLWDVATGKQVRQLAGTRYAGRLTFSPDGKALAVVGDDHVLRLHNAATGKEIRDYGPHREDLHGAAAFSPDGKTLAAGNRGGVILWDVSTGQELLLLTVIPGRANVGFLSVAFSPDGKTLASGDGDGCIRLWDVATGKRLRKMERHRQWVEAVAFSPDGKTLASGGFDHAVRLWDSATGEELCPGEGHQHRVVGFAFAPDGKTLASYGHDATVRLWDAATGKELRQLPGHPGVATFCLAYSPDGATLATGEGSNMLLLREVATGKEIRQFKANYSLNYVAFAPDGKTLVTGGYAGPHSHGDGEGGSLRLWD